MGNGVSALRSLRFVTRQRGLPAAVLAWVLLLFFVPVVGPLLMMGYTAELHQRLVHDEASPLPEFTLGEARRYWQQGTAPFIATLVYSLPGFVLQLLAAAAWLSLVVPGIGSPTVLGADATWPLADNVGPSAGTLVVSLFLVFPVALLAHLPALASRLLAERTGSLATALAPRQVWAVLRQAWAKLLLGYATFAILAGLLLMAGTVVLCVGALVVSAGLHVASAHLRWQIASTLRDPVPPAAPRGVGPDEAAPKNANLPRG